jgi:hypothetical protein
MLYQELDHPAEQPRGRAAALPGAYIAVVLAAIVAAFAFHMRTAGIFTCPAGGYGDSYLGYCQGTAYGDYDHGALWWGLEPGVREAAAAADIVFVGNSRMVFGFSAPALNDWADAHGASFYLLGFSHNETAKFTWPLLKSLEPQARAYVIAVDKFFFERESPPAAEIMHVADTRERYDAKRAWQAPHRLICGTLPLCGDSVSYYRQRDTGQWRLMGSDGIAAQKIESDRPEYIKGDPELLATITANARDFLADLEGLGVDRSCVILTYLPSTENNRLLANALATELDMPLIAPQGEGLVTMDSSHLDPPSAQIFTAGFLDEAGPRLAGCLDGKVAGG